MEPTSTQTQTKLGGYEFYNKVLGGGKYIVAPMVDQSELAWRILSRRYGANVAYTPMINANNFASIRSKTFREANFSIANKEEGDEKLDRPLIVQFCGDDPQQILEAAKIVEPHCDAVDINLGCPQDIAKRGHYGSFLQDDWDVIYRIINTLHVNLKIPVTAKFRVFPTVEKTVEYAKMLESAGAQILTCHGRTREQRGVLAGLADWSKIKAVREAVSVPVFANGNILYFSDIARCLEFTGADAVMSAEGNLYNPALFRPALMALKDSSDQESKEEPDESGKQDISPEVSYPEHISHVDLALEYIEIVKSLKTPTNPSAVKGHLFKILRPGLAKAVDLRDRLGKPAHKSKKDIKPSEGQSTPSELEKTWLEEYEDIVLELKKRMDKDYQEAEGTSEAAIILDTATGTRKVPHWLSQPYFRPPPPPPPPNKRQKKDMMTYLESRAEETKP